ncbi:MAG: hypothetical protein JO112_23300, partial [Planctomycetes bacterium]|nr:hypothetical protein [Planctomycetota bacterium]
SEPIPDLAEPTPPVKLVALPDGTVAVWQPSSSGGPGRLQPAVFAGSTVALDRKQNPAAPNAAGTGAPSPAAQSLPTPAPALAYAAPPQNPPAQPASAATSLPPIPGLVPPPLPLTTAAVPPATDLTFLKTEGSPPTEQPSATPTPQTSARDPETQRALAAAIQHLNSNLKTLQERVQSMQDQVEKPAPVRITEGEGTRQATPQPIPGENAALSPFTFDGNAEGLPAGQPGKPVSPPH